MVTATATSNLPGSSRSCSARLAEEHRRGRRPRGGPPASASPTTATRPRATTRGHGSWAPIMGAGYDHPISQWSKGDYPGANNTAGRRRRHQGGAWARAPTSPAAVSPRRSPCPSATSYIDSRTDVDVYQLGTCTGPVTCRATPDSLADLDIKLTLLDAAGHLVATADPPSGTDQPVRGLRDERLDHAVTGFRHLLRLRRRHRQRPLEHRLRRLRLPGRLHVSTTGNCDGAGPTGVPSAATALSATPDPSAPNVTLTWGAPTAPGAGGAVIGYLLTRSGSDEVVQVPARDQLHVVRARVRQRLHVHRDAAQRPRPRHDVRRRHHLERDRAADGAPEPDHHLDPVLEQQLVARSAPASASSGRSPPCGLHRRGRQHLRPGTMALLFSASPG